MHGNNLKRVAAGFLAGALILSGTLNLPENHQNVYAAKEAVTVDEEKALVEKRNVSEFCVDGENGEKERTAPKPLTSGHEEWVFAGWYTEEGCAQANALSKDTFDGEAYAKFVPAELLSVRCQTLAGTNGETEKSKLRLISVVDSPAYASVGFEMQMKGWKHTYDTDTVCKEVAMKEGGVPYNYVPKDIHPMGAYFTTVTLTGIVNGNFSDGFFIRPYWKTLDGTTVYGVSRYARVEDSYLNIVNVPVRLYRNQDIAAGYLKVTCDNPNLSYYGWDAGKVLDEMEVNGAGASVRCVGNVGKIDSNVKADGMYVNLRFQWTGTGKLEQDVTFTVSDTEFCDNEEQNEALDVANVVYKYIKSSKAAN